MKVHMKKLAVLMLAGTLVLSGIVQPTVAKAEGLEEQTEEVLDSVTQEEEKKDVAEDADKRVALIVDKDGNEIEGYTSLEDAVNAVKDGQTVKLEKNVSLSAPLTIREQKAFTLDIHGHNLGMEASAGKKVLMNVGTGQAQDIIDLILTDSAEKKGKVESKAPAAEIAVRQYSSLTTKDVVINFADADNKAANTALQVQGTLTVERGTKIDSTEYGITVVGKGATVIVNDGEIDAKLSAVSGNGTMHETEITINGGTLKSSDSAGIYHPQKGKLTLNGGTITGLTGVQMCSGSLDIPKNSKVKVIATGEDNRDQKDGGDGTIDDGAAISIVNRDYPGGMPAVNIKGGSFVAEKTDNAVLAYTWDINETDGDKYSDWAEAGEQVAISGGTYNTPIADELLVDGFGMNEPDKNGNYGVHEHKMTKVGKKDATCTKDGVKQTCYKCEACGKYFEDEEGTVEITDVENLIIPAKGHLDENKDGKCDICGASMSDKPNPDTDTGKVPNGSSDDGNGSNDKGKTDKGAVKTGDTANIAGYMSIMILAAGIVVLAIDRKRRTK